MPPNTIIFATLLTVAVLAFCISCYRRFRLVRLGEPEDRFDHPGLRLRKMLLYAFGQRRVVAKPFGMNHLVLFWSFILLLLSNVEFVLQGLSPGFGLGALPATLHHGLLFLFDVASLLALAAALLAISRRIFFPAASMSSNYVKARSAEGFLILSFIVLLMLAYFGLHGAEIAMGEEDAAAAMPVSSLAAALLTGSSPAQLQSLSIFCWWLHALVLLSFIAYLPQSKHMHILTALPNCFFASLGRPNTQPREEFVRGNSHGVTRVDQFTWKDLLDGFSCTECGRCQEVCPAAATGKPLNPRQVVHAIKTNLLENGTRLRQGMEPALPLIGEEAEGSSTEKGIWSCTTCGACMSVCPVLIEQMPKVIKMRRDLVQMRSSFPQELTTLFENLEGRGNPWGIAPTERTKWHAAMPVRPFQAGETEYLFYVGCAGALDTRQKQATVAMASILDAADVSWGILGKEESCCGDSLRRLGNEFVFDQVARENVRLFSERGVKKIITQCPHCYSTLKNDYRQYGAELEVVHHSELIPKLLVSGRLKLETQVQGFGRILFHDSCYLGRHNDIYEPPRQALEQATGRAPEDFRRHGKESFCCGAGGGRMWQEEHGERINLSRVQEALEQSPDTICVSCPYCMTMLADGLKDLQAGGVKVLDLAEVVAEGVHRS